MSTINTWRVHSVDESTYQPLGYEQLTPSAATKLTPPANADFALIQAESADASWRDDGTNPTLTTGMKIIGKDTIQYAGDLSEFAIISSGTVNVSYYKYGA